MKRGDKFLHAFWHGEDGKPLRCVITCVRSGVVFWTHNGYHQPRGWFDADAASKHVKEWLPAAAKEYLATGGKLPVDTGSMQQ